MLVNSRVTPMVLGAVMFILAFSLLVTVLYIHRFRRRFDDMMAVLNKFRQGDFTARFAVRDQDELELVTGSFNKMADLLLDNIDRVTASEKERRDFMVNISHDLRTPLAIARGYAETLQLKKGQLQPEEVAAYSELVVGKLRQVEKMVAQLFELSKMESASFETNREAVCVFGSIAGGGICVGRLWRFGWLWRLGRRWRPVVHGPGDWIAAIARMARTWKRIFR